MGDEKDHVTIQKKDVESASHEVETQDFETATESISPLTLQLKAEETKEEEGGEKEKGESGAFQFPLAPPPNNPGGESSRTFGTDSVQGKGIAEPFKIPIVQKKKPNLSRTEIVQSLHLPYKNQYSVS